MRIVNKRYWEAPGSEVRLEKIGQRYQFEHQENYFFYQEKKFLKAATDVGRAKSNKIEPKSLLILLLKLTDKTKRWT